MYCNIIVALYNSIATKWGGQTHELAQYEAGNPGGEGGRPSLPPEYTLMPYSL